MSHLLLEVGCEELPATAVRRAVDDLETKLREQLAADGLLEEGATFRTHATPRRLIVAIDGLKDRQADATKEQRGPGLKAAYGADGAPTPALLGFCRSQGVAPEELRQEGDYVWVTKTIPGRSASEVLAERLPAAIRSLTFDKTMRWGASRMRFARPIRWILASLDGAAVPFEIEGVAAGTQSRGHRFYSPEPFEAPSLDALLKGLAERKVEPDADKRKAKILNEIAALAGDRAVLDPALVDENVQLTEWPTAIEGRFREEFLELPDPVLVTAMAKHEKMFPVKDEDGRLTNRFVFVRNSGEDATVRQGAEWVLNARFNDAKFFFDQDRALKMDDFLERTTTMVFQEKLGTVRQRADRLATLAEEIAKMTGGDEAESGYARQAGKYCKADLSSGLVGELANLQGIVGGLYARREGWPGAVAWAIETHYDPSKNPDPANCEGERTALRVTMADQLDKMAGYLGLGLEPTGSSDPYALRRAATLLIECAWAWPGAMPPFDQLLETALAQYRAQGVELDEKGALSALSELFAGRYATLMPDVRYDVLEAALLREMPWESALPQGVRTRAAALATLAADQAFVQTATRPLNIVAAAKKKGLAYAWEDPLRHVVEGDLDSESGTALLAALRAQEEEVFLAAREGKSDDLVARVRTLAAPIDAFFDSTMVMVDQEATRYARLTLLHACCLQLLAAGDFTKLVFDDPKRA